MRPFLTRRFCGQSLSINQMLYFLIWACLSRLICFVVPFWVVVPISPGVIFFVRFGVQIVQVVQVVKRVLGVQENPSCPVPKVPGVSFLLWIGGAETILSSLLLLFVKVLQKIAITFEFCWLVFSSKWSLVTSSKLCIFRCGYFVEPFICMRVKSLSLLLCLFNKNKKVF